MRKINSTFVKYPFYANVIIVILILAGGYSILNMKKSFFPDRSTTHIFVNVFYPGASPKEMEESITVRIEESLRGLVGIKEVTSSSSENFASVNIETTGKYDIDITLAERKILNFGKHSLLQNCWVGGSGYLMRRECVEQQGLLEQNKSFSYYFEIVYQL